MRVCRVSRLPHLFCAFALTGCTFGGDARHADAVTTVIGSAGGKIAMAGGASLDIPAGALANDTAITIAQSSATSPAGALSPVYEFGPDGTTFSKPATVTLPVPQGTNAGSVYWSAAGASYDELPTMVQGTSAVAQIVRLSRGFVGAPCGTAGGSACAARRDVTGTFDKVFWTDDGTKTRVHVPQPGVSISALVPTASGYQRLPGTFSPDGSSFTIHAVPAGRYFLQIEGMPRQQGPILYEFTTNTPDLSSVVSYRSDLARATLPTPVTLNVSNLDPWTPGTTITGDRFEISSSQANLSLRPWLRSAGPPAGSTSFTSSIDWSTVPNVVADNASAGLPDASKGDVVWFYQARHQTIGSGAATAVYLPATKAARVSNLTLRDGAAASIDVQLAPVPQTGRFTPDVRYSQFAALAPDVNPSARSNQFSFDVFAKPHGVQFPDSPEDAMVVRPLLIAYDFTTGASSLPDVVYSTIPYGQFSDRPLWQEFRQTLYFYDVTVSPPAAAPFTWTAIVSVQEPMSLAPIAPALGPVRAPRVNGRDLFQTQMGVGLQPAISWSAPAVGTPTSVMVFITDVATGTVLQATVRSGSSFTVPNGVLAPGKTYVVTLEAQQAPWDGPDAPPLRYGVPLYTADCITSTFTP